MAVISRSGEVIGGLFFGHEKPGRFSDRHERLMIGLAAQAAIGIDNARLYRSAQHEIAERTRAEARLTHVSAELEEALHAKEVLLHEVNHRVKNSLQVVTGLLMLQASQASEPDLRQALLEARGRIAVVAAMHQRLYSTSQHDRVDVGD